MRVLVVLFGGLDHQFLERWPCTNLRQARWGKVVVDELWNQRDVATQITAQFLTGKTWRENGVDRRKRVEHVYTSGIARFLEQKVFRNARFARGTRHKLYAIKGWSYSNSREFLAADLRCPSLFDLVPDSRAVYVPAWNPEPSWALDRNILDPRRFPELGVEGALDLREKNYSWRRKRFLEALDDGPYQLLVGQFQYLDSTQHLYLSYVDPPDMAKVEEAYWRMDEFAGEILERARGRYDRVLFLSDNGAARKKDYKPTHHNRPYYSISDDVEVEGTNLRDFFGHVLRWVGEEPNAGAVHGR